MNNSGPLANNSGLSENNSGNRVNRAEPRVNNNIARRNNALSKGLSSIAGIFLNKNKEINAETYNKLNELSSNNIAMLAESVNLQPYAISLITYGQRSFLLINDKLNAFNPKADGFIEITGYSGNINSYIIA